MDNFRIKQLMIAYSRHLWPKPWVTSGSSGFVGYVVPRNKFVTKVKTDEQNKNVDKKVKNNEKSSNSISPKTSKRQSFHSKEILDYFGKESISIDINNLPQKILKRKRSAPEALYIVDKTAAKQFVSTIKPYILNGKSPILEANPGLGLVTEELLSVGVPNLYLYEPTISFNAQLNTLKNKYPGKIEVNNSDLFLLYKQAFQDKIDNGSRVASMLSGVTKKQWTDDPAMRIVGALPHVNFLKHLIISFIFQNGIMMYGRPELFFVIPPPLFIHLTCNSSAGYLQYRATTVLFQLIFKSKLLGKLPRRAYLPWEVEYQALKKSKLTKVRCVDPDYLYLVRIEPREDFFQKVVSANHLQPLWYFIRQNLLSRKNRVIPQLEKWVPGCGPRLIVGGMNIFTQFGDLTPQEILAVFKEFSSWPEYPDCTFLPSMETNFIKMETITDEIEKDLDENLELEHEAVEDDGEVRH